MSEWGLSKKEREQVEKERVARMNAAAERQHRKNNSRDAIDKRKAQTAWWKKKQDGE